MAGLLYYHINPVQWKQLKKNKSWHFSPAPVKRKKRSNSLFAFIDCPIQTVLIAGFFFLPLLCLKYSKPTRKGVRAQVKLPFIPALPAHWFADSHASGALFSLWGWKECFVFFFLPLCLCVQPHSLKLLVKEQGGGEIREECGGVLMQADGEHVSVLGPFAPPRQRRRQERQQQQQQPPRGQASPEPASHSPASKFCRGSLSNREFF